MDSRQLISASILAALEGAEFPSFAELEGEASKEIVSLVKSYDYSASSALKERALGKSEEFRQQLLRSVSNPARARELREQFLQSVRDIESSDRIFDYVSPDRARNIVKIRELLASAKSS